MKRYIFTCALKNCILCAILRGLKLVVFRVCNEASTDRMVKFRNLQDCRCCFCRSNVPDPEVVEAELGNIESTVDSILGF